MDRDYRRQADEHAARKRAFRRADRERQEGRIDTDAQQVARAKKLVRRYMDRLR